MSTFQFVSFNGPDDIKQDEKRKHVRAYVMKKYHRHRKIARAIRIENQNRKSGKLESLSRHLACAVDSPLRAAFDENNGESPTVLQTQFKIGSQIIMSGLHTHGLIEQRWFTPGE
jgi:hypothetical protein